MAEMIAKRMPDARKGEIWGVDPGRVTARGIRTTARTSLSLAVMGVILNGCASRPRGVETISLRQSLPATIGFAHADHWRLQRPDNNHATLSSPRITTAQGWKELVASWNVQPADGTALVVEIEVPDDTGRNHPYDMGHWSPGPSPAAARTSVPGQKDAFAEVKTDTLVLKDRVHDFRVRITLEGNLARDPGRLRLLTLSLSDPTREPPPRSPLDSVWGKTLNVPERSQIAYPGGRPWCSPTAVSMLLAWWSGRLKRPELDHDVPEVATSVFDPAWPGTGNWPFNMAYAGSLPGLMACAARLRDLRDVEALVAAGIPVALSVQSPALRGEAPQPEGGHLIVCVGFTDAGAIVANDPWARLERGQRVRRVYPRPNVERAWSHSHRTAYLVAPASKALKLPIDWR